MKKIYLMLALLIAGFGIQAKADEGMWLPSLIQGQTYDDMVRLGVELTPEQIYDVNNSSLKDAIVRLGGGFCTGEIISSEGLMLTNHHCGYGAINNLSGTGDKNYLENGFWAMKRSDEKPAGFAVSFLQKIVDVTDQVTADLTDDMSEEKRANEIRKVSSKLIEEYSDEDKHISCNFKTFFEGNKFYVFIYQDFPDVRLVGAPPESLGKYGGETDNWMWPRHTCDFSMFRVYANKDNQPAAYSEDNVPYKPKHHLPVSLKGISEGDFAMIFGYPGSTDRYLTSYGVRNATDVEFPARVNVRRSKLDIYEKYMDMSESNRLKYATKYAQVSNYWKNFMGQTRGLKRLNIADRKAKEEQAFDKWANADAERKKEYGKVIAMYEAGYATRNNYSLSAAYINEAAYGIEALAFAYTQMAQLNRVKDNPDELAKVAESLSITSKDHFAKYIPELDQEVFAAMAKHMYEDLPHDQLPEDFVKMVEKFKMDYDKMAAKLYKKSFLDDSTAVYKFLEKPNVKKMQKDPLYKMMASLFNNYFTNIRPKMMEANEELAKAKRLYVRGLMEMNPNKRYASDANSTMRLTYGSVKDYYPADAVHYDYFTTMDGVMEKYVPNDGEFDLPERYIQLAKAREYGQYADKDGEMHVCFLTNNDITGGNSGSPVINGKGQLIGTAFDGNWEAMSGDIAFEPELQRTISVDIRYTLWVIDVYAGAGHLVDEMTVIK